MNDSGEPKLALLANRGFQNFESFAEGLDGWDLDFTQLSAGSAPYALLQAASENLVVSRFSLGAAFEQRGSATPGMHTFAIIDRTVAPVSVGGMSLASDGIAIFPLTDEFAAVNQCAYRGYTLSFSEALIQRSLDVLDTDLGDLYKTSRHGTIKAPIAALDSIRSQLDQWARGTQNSGVVGELCEFSLCTELLQTLLGGAQTDARPPRHNRRQLIIERAKAYIEVNLTSPIPVPVLASACSTSVRSLEYAFRDTLGTTPKRYILSRKLHATRQALQAKPDNEPVSSIAHRYGFSHLGQFAADYKKRFGELPSQTSAGR